MKETRDDERSGLLYVEERSGKEESKQSYAPSALIEQGIERAAELILLILFAKDLKYARFS